jgi:hypothetical protein
MIKNIPRHVSEHILASDNFASESDRVNAISVMESGARPTAPGLNIWNRGMKVVVLRLL